MALEVAKYKIRVNCICPGGINTPIFNVQTSDANQMEQLLAAGCPLKRSGHSEDIANMALFLASDESEWVTGTAMVVDGGLTAGSSIFGQQTASQVLTVPGDFAGPSFETKV